MAAICHPDGPEASGKIFELGAGFVAEIRWERSDGAIFKTDPSFTPSAVGNNHTSPSTYYHVLFFRSKRDGPKLPILTSLPSKCHAFV